MGVSTSPHKVVNAAPHQARESKTCQQVSKIVRCQLTDIQVWFTLELIPKAAALCSLALSRANLVLVLSKNELRPKM